MAFYFSYFLKFFPRQFSREIRQSECACDQNTAKQGILSETALSSFQKFMIISN